MYAPSLPLTELVRPPELTLTLTNATFISGNTAVLTSGKLSLCVAESKVLPWNQGIPSQFWL